MFRGLFAMNDACDHCGLKYERAPGYFLGSTYINYMLTAVILTFSYITLHFGRDISNRDLMPWLGGFCVIFPLWFHRRSRGLWQALDSWFDTADFWNDDSPENPPSPTSAGPPNQGNDDVTTETQQN